MLSRLNRPLSLLTLLIASLNLSSCGASQPGLTGGSDSSRFNTDLGLTGNGRVRRNFEAYKAGRGEGCTGAGAQTKRLLLTGFGPFNKKKNVSGAVVGLLQDPQLWSERMSWPEGNSWAHPSFQPDDSPGTLGASASQRTLWFDGQQIEVCFLRLTVEWDFAAAVILHEAERFKPDFILMTGYGVNPTGLRLEAGALNETMSLPGYDPRGRWLGEMNRPVSTWIVPPQLQMPHELPMGWSTVKIARASAPRLQQASAVVGRNEAGRVWEFVPMPSADPENDYICNNISYVVLAALQSKPIPLAGGQLIVNPRFSKTPRAAFLHYPFEADVSSPQEVWTWAHVLMSVAVSSLVVDR